ncbi:MAG: NACHT domain-containing protein [Egibacteraceae bacterium]
MAQDRCFIGRRRALGELAHWLKHQPADGSIRVVTGGAGSGKSALLAHLVAPEDPRGRARAQGEDDVWIAVRAAGLDLAQVTRCIAAALSSTAEEPSTLIRTVRDRCLVVVDALDEAATSAEAWAVATRLLVPLAQVEGVKVLVGTRPDRSFVRALGRRPTIIDLDQPPYFDPDDLIKYAARSLCLHTDPSASSPYRHDPAVTARVANAIAEAAQPSFLAAGLAARARAHEPQVIDTSMPGWQQRTAFPTDIDTAIADYLDTLEDPKRAFDLLVPVAFARNPGLPRDTLWAALAQAYSGDPYGPVDIDWLFASTASYLLEEDESHRVRLFHQALVDHLRSRTQPSMVERTITSVLRQRAEAAGGWLHAERYARAHTASHAAQAGGGLLDGLVTDPAFLLAADRCTLLRALPAISQPQARRAGRCYRAVATRMEGDPAAGAAYLELASRSMGNTTLAERIRQLGQPQPFTTQLARHRLTADLLVLHGHTGQVYAVAWGSLHGAPLLASASADATIRLWNPADSTQLRILHGHTHEVYAVAWGSLHGAPLLASASADATIRLWDPADSTQLRISSTATPTRCTRWPGASSAARPCSPPPAPTPPSGCGTPPTAPSYASPPRPHPRGVRAGLGHPQRHARARLRRW